MRGGMTRTKATITVDREKLDEVRGLLGASSASAAIDLALSEVLHRARLRRDVEAYRRVPKTGEEVGVADIDVDWQDLADETDWEMEWPEPA